MKTSRRDLQETGGTRPSDRLREVGRPSLSKYLSIPKRTNQISFVLKRTHSLLMTNNSFSFFLH